jgi:ABC-type multidrug transport system permease subunit
VQYLVDLARDLNVPVIMTIHQPAAIVFDMLPDLYLLEAGRLAFFGPITAAQRFASDLGRQMTAQMAEDKERETRAGAVVQVYDEPSYYQRLVYLTAFFLRYFGVNPGYYLYRAIYLILCAVYIGTLYLDLNTNTSQLIKYSGSIFFSIWTTLFAAVGSTGLIASDRRQSFEQIKNGIITPSISCAASFIASLPYNLLCAFAFQLIFHWVSNINPRGEPFIYAVILTMGHLVMMEAIMSIVVEVVKDAMLSVTCAMLVMGMFFLMPGFFIQVSAMPAWISWMSYIMPTKVPTSSFYLSS